MSLLEDRKFETISATNCPFCEKKLTMIVKENFYFCNSCDAKCDFVSYLMTRYSMPFDVATEIYNKKNVKYLWISLT